MIIKISYNTDLRYPDTSVEAIPNNKWKSYLRSISAKNKDSQQEFGYAFPGAADASLPVSQQNWHRRVCSFYEMDPKDYKMAVKKAKERFRADKGGSMYSPRKWEDCLSLPLDCRYIFQ